MINQPQLATNERIGEPPAQARRNSTGPGSPDWLGERAAESGITVKEETTKLERYQCRQCDGRIKLRRESGADAQLISDLLWLAWQDRYDVAIIVSGDHDLLPSIERIQLSGRKAVAALFDGESLNTRARCRMCPLGGHVREVQRIGFQWWTSVSHPAATH